jgi:hypothetical protein
MISFNYLGNLGRLGNQMFQYASLKGIAKNRGYDFIIPPREVFGKKDQLVNSSELNLYNIFDLDSSNTIGLTQNKVQKEYSFKFDEILFSTCEDNVDLYGFFQSEKYFKHITDDIKKDFSFNTNILNQCKQFYKDNFNNYEVISLHIRRGDYTQNPNHPTQLIEYYKNALNNLPQVSVIIFSDDPDWCKSQKLFDSDKFFISENNSVDFDLCLMTLCYYHIIANSSFSWWGAWLSNSKKVIAPKNWFGGACINHSTEDLYCSDWIIL